MKELIVERQERLLRLRLHRPEKRNALDAALCAALVQACENAEQDPGVGAILLEAEGPAFCAGMDLEEALAPDAAARLEVHERLFTLGLRLTKPIVAAVQGPALAGGTGLVANAHIVVAAHGSSFGLTEIRIGMWPFVIYRAVVAAVGDRRALELALTGKVFGVNEAVQYGLVHEVVPPVELEDRAEAIALHVAAQAREVVMRGMSFVRQSRLLTWRETTELAQSLRTENFASPDFQEGVRSFLEKRRPDWPSNR
jgi:enoyl-CoA hydratase/carnithine racemase